jgi:hypothetical protein
MLEQSLVCRQWRFQAHDRMQIPPSGLQISQRGAVSFGNNAKGNILGSGNVNAGKLNFDNVNLVDNLKFNLLSVSQMCDKGYGAFFTDKTCKIVTPAAVKMIEKVITNHISLTAKRSDNVYVVNMLQDNDIPVSTCLISKASSKEVELWHRRLGHVNLQTINTLAKQNLVRGLPLKEFQCDEHCVSCLKGKQHKVSYKSIEESKTTACLQMLHMDLFGPIRIMSLSKKRYCLVIIDDY